MTTRTVTIPAGTILVLDIKTGRMNLDYSKKFAPQIAAYAGGVPYDPETDTRTAWPFEVDQSIGLIAHIPVADIIATGRCTVSLVLVDLEAGRHAAELCVAAKAWGARKDIFGAPLPVVEAEVGKADSIVSDALWDQIEQRDQEPAREVPGLRELMAAPDPFDGLDDKPTAAEQARTAALARMDALSDAERALVKARWPFTVGAKRLAVDDVPRLVALLDDVARDAGAGFTATEVPDVVTPDPRILAARPEPPAWTPPEPGADLDAATITAMQKAGKKLHADCKAWVGARMGEAASAGRAIESPVKTVRWLEVCRALMDSAICYTDRLDRDTDLLRALIHAATGEAMAEQPGVTLGMVYGSLTIDQARATAALMQEVYDGTKTPAAIVAELAVAA